MDLTRRAFLGAAAAMALRADRSGTILVVVQLAGGNDGLNTVVPYEDDHYGRARTTLRLSDRQVLKLEAGLGLHPAMQGFARLYGEGKLGILQGVGYPKMNRNHDAGMACWQTGRVVAPKKGEDVTGWLGRVADAGPDGSTPVAFVGSIGAPLTVEARDAVVPIIRKATDWIAAPPRVEASYPELPLAQSLKTVAQLMRAEIGVRVFLTEQGGGSPGEFDNHSNQSGIHAISLRELSESVAAFCQDLKRDGLFDRVLLMTYSEFGRQLTENGRHGTGHGAAAPVFLAGGRIKSGLIGAHPGLGDLEDDAPRPHTDFRALYATVLEAWLGIGSEAILGGRYLRLPIFA